MNTSIKKKKTRQEPMYYELAEWFYAQGQDLLEQEIILKRIKALKEKRGLFDPRVGIEQREFTKFIKECREYLETRLSCTLVNIRFGGKRGAYKVANEQEATLYGVKQYKKFIVMSDRVRRITPLMKRQYIWPSVKKVFGEAQEEASRFKRFGDKFLLAYDEGEKVYKETIKDENTNSQK